MKIIGILIGIAMMLAIGWFSWRTIRSNRSVAKLAADEKQLAANLDSPIMDETFAAEMEKK